MKKKVIIIGAGNVGGFLALNKDLFDLDFEIVGFLDDNKNKIGQKFWDIPVLGSVDEVVNYKEHSIVIGIANPRVKKMIVNRIGEDYDFLNFISKNSWVSNNVELGKGVIIYPNTSINYESKIDDFVIINMNCAIGHNVIIGKGSSLAPGVNFAGFTNVKPFTEIGIGVCTIQKSIIGRESIIGGQSMIIKEVEQESICVGVPAKKIKTNKPMNYIL